jgi:hypothetical protein
VKKILIDGGQLVDQNLVQVLNHFAIALHKSSLDGRP